MDKGIIKKVIDKTTVTGKPYKTVLINDVWINSFNFAVNETIKEGINVEYELKQEGEYKNLEKITPLNDKTAEKIEEIHINNAKPDKDTRIGRLAVLNTSVELHKQTEEELSNEELLKSVKRVAEDLERWVNR